MTSTADRADTTQHPDVSEISDLAEGLLSPSRSAAVRRHVDGCPSARTCGPPWRRSGACSAPCRGRPGCPSRSRAGSMPPSPPKHSSTPPPLAATHATTTATTATVVFHVKHRIPPWGLLPSLPGLGPPRRAPPRGHRPRSPRRPRRRIALFSTIGAAFGAAILGTSLYLSQAGDMAGDGVANGVRRADASAEVAAAPFSGSPVEERVQDLLSKDRTLRTPQGVGPESMSSDTGTTSRRSGDGTVPACVLAGTGRTDPVLAHERGEYRGSPPICSSSRTPPTPCTSRPMCSTPPVPTGRRTERPPRCSSARPTPLLTLSSRPGHVPRGGLGNARPLGSVGWGERPRQPPP